MFNKIFLKQRLRNIREHKKLSRPQVSKATNIPIPTLEGWESKNHLPLLNQLYVLAEYYDVSVDYILGRTDNPEVNR